MVEVYAFRGWKSLEGLSRSHQSLDDDSLSLPLLHHDIDGTMLDISLHIVCFLDNP